MTFMPDLLDLNQLEDMTNNMTIQMTNYASHVTNIDILNMLAIKIQNVKVQLNEPLNLTLYDLKYDPFLDLLDALDLDIVGQYVDHKQLDTQHLDVDIQDVMTLYLNAQMTAMTARMTARMTTFLLLIQLDTRQLWTYIIVQNAATVARYDLNMDSRMLDLNLLSS